ncbi:MAG TPA: MarR family transcriptional regulator [Trebonia sp.]|jgi:DNA-binding MarR family transcriptional regulator|nr:MarR family transcriptional regulator [Trebonia sp.]
MSIEIDRPEAARAEESAPALDRDILDALTTLIKRAGSVAHSIAAEFEVSPPDLLAMFKLEGALAMKELAQRLGCDASFVTAIADNLEKRGFVRREPSQRDRRIKNLVLTPDGLSAKERLMAQLAAKMPWCYALDDAERRCFLSLLRKMLDAPSPDAGTDAGPGGQSNQPVCQPPGQPASATVTADHRHGLAGTPGAAAGHEPTGY